MGVFEHLCLLLFNVFLLLLILHFNLLHKLLSQIVTLLYKHKLLFAEGINVDAHLFQAFPFTLVIKAALGHNLVFQAEPFIDKLVLTLRKSQHKRVGALELIGHEVLVLQNVLLQKLQIDLLSPAA